MERIYLIAALHMIRWNRPAGAIQMLGAALGECNRTGNRHVQAKVLRVLSYCHRI